MSKKIKSHCIDWGKELKRTSTKRCRKCHFKHNRGFNHPACKHGKACKDKKYFCIDCGKQISNYQHQRCLSCANSGKNHPNFIDGKSMVIHFCLGCGKEIDYNSIRCRQCAGKQRKGKNNPNYKHGEGEFPYPLKFSKELKDQIRNRDNYTCQNCGINEEEHKQIYHQKLHVHHINYNKNNNDKENLITLCRKCNIKANSNCDYWFAYYMYQ